MTCEGGCFMHYCEGCPSNEVGLSSKEKKLLEESFKENKELFKTLSKM